MESTSVYSYFDKYGVLIYVGITSRNTVRQREHISTKDWWPHVASQEVEHFSAREVASLRERLLIQSNEPPFNTQHNPASEIRRAEYLSFRQSADETGLSSHEELWRDTGGIIPLHLISQVDTEVVLATDPGMAPIVCRLTEQGYRQAKAVAGSVKCGHSTDIRLRGMVAAISLHLRKGVEVDDPYMRTKMIPSRQGTKYTVRNVQVSPLNPVSVMAHIA